MSKPRILVVEDESDIRRFVRLSLEREGMTVFEAIDAEQGRIESASRQPELLIIDLDMGTLRQKLEAGPTRPPHLITELQVGYRVAGLST